MVELSEAERDDVADGLVKLLMNSNWVSISQIPILFKAKCGKDLSKYQKNQKLRPFLSSNFSDILQFRTTKGTTVEVALTSHKKSNKSEFSAASNLSNRLQVPGPAAATSSNSTASSNTDARAALTRKLMVVGVSKEEEAKAARLKTKWATRRRAKEWF